MITLHKISTCSEHHVINYVYLYQSRCETNEQFTYLHNKSEECFWQEPEKRNRGWVCIITVVSVYYILVLAYKST